MLVIANGQHAARTDTGIYGSGDWIDNVQYQNDSTIAIEHGSQAQRIRT
jgi:hypothetical protein